ncbi:hypothetical protein Cni_G08554 [Canna indica]|uniref:RING-type E3 ubiquitin transferase n=1 Tax=Canna indica TaxID=4628 RepID=A0AAQ3K335_9LILI|nr:hypothetical protein Cni_G08554 [Canna indica]
MAISVFPPPYPSSSPPSPPPPEPDPKLLRHLLHLFLNACPSPSSSPFRLGANFASLPRILKQLAVLFEELLLRDDDTGGLALPRAASLSFREIFHVLHRSQALFQDCSTRSRGFLLLHAESLTAELHELVLDLATFLDIIPLTELQVSEDVKDLVRLLRRQLRRSSPTVDPAVLSLRRDILELVVQVESGTVPDLRELRGIVRRLGIDDCKSCHHEIECIERDITEESWASLMVALAGILRYSRCVLFGASSSKTDSSDREGGKKLTLQGTEDIVVPMDFRCPISLELMRDPVVVATGQTYDRESIVRWIGSGHLTCPNSGQALAHVELVPNRALRNLIARWCRDNSIPFDESDPNSNKKKSAGAANDAARANKAAMEAARMTANFLVEQLETAKSTESTNCIVHEIRLLAKHGSYNRAFIAEAGGIPLLQPLLLSADALLQGNAVTALLNLSILEANKRLIMQADGSLDVIVHVLADGATWRAKENAAATVLSISSIHDYRRQLARHPRLVETLVQMVRDGPVSAKKDALTAILSLAGDRENIRRLVECRVVRAALDAAAEQEVMDEAAAVLAALTRRGGAEAVAEADGAVTGLVGVLRRGSDWARESAAAALVAVCRMSGAMVVAELAALPGIHWVILELMEAGTERAKRKAASLGRIFRRWAAAVEAEQAATYSETTAPVA